MALKEFYEVDESTGEIIEVHVLDDQLDTIPYNFVEGWGQGFFDPIYNFHTRQWEEKNTSNDLLNRYKEQKIEDLNRQCKEEIEKGFEYNGNYYEFEPHDQDNFTQALALLSFDTETQSLTWKTLNNGIVTLSREEFFGVCKKAEQVKRGNIAKYWMLKAEVESATSIEEIDSITWTS